MRLNPIYTLQPIAFNPCTRCISENENIWKYLLKRTLKFQTSFTPVGPIMDGWHLYDCSECTNSLLLKKDFAPTTFNTRYDINYRFISKLDKQFLTKWRTTIAQRNLGQPPEFPSNSDSATCAPSDEDIDPTSRQDFDSANAMTRNIFQSLSDIGATKPLWFEESASTPCSVKMSDGTYIDFVEYQIPKSPPIPNRMRTSIEEATLWDRYEAVILIENIDAVLPSDSALPHAIREGFETNYSPMVEKQRAASLTITDGSGQQFTVAVPPGNWSIDNRVDVPSLKPVKTSGDENLPQLTTELPSLFLLI